VTTTIAVTVPVAVAPTPFTTARWRQPGSQNDPDSVQPDGRRLDAVLAHDVDLNTVMVPLLYCRLADSQIAYSYQTDLCASCLLKFVELPQETATADPGSGYTAYSSEQSRLIQLFRFTKGATVTYLADYGVDLVAGSLSWTASNITAQQIVSETEMLGDALEISIGTDSATHPFVDFLQRLNFTNTTVEVFEYDVINDAVDLTAPVVGSPLVRGLG
jgi:hypothetical protein